ncbi:MAG: hypothetical protein ACLQVF_22315 [Isosphaeraceae bacterium]
MKRVSGENGGSSNGREAGRGRPKPVELALDRFAITRLIEAFIGACDSFEEILLADVANITAEVAGENPSPLEHYLATEVGVNWLLSRLLDREYARMMENRGEVRVRGLDHIQRTRSRAHRRAMATVRTLEAVRRCELDLGRIEAKFTHAGRREPKRKPPGRPQTCGAN